MKIEIWSDIVCPWCGLGTRGLMEAASDFAQAGAVDILHRSFLLGMSVDAPEGKAEPAADVLRRLKGMSRAQIDQIDRRISEMGRQAGFSEYHVADNMVGNTFLAHEFLAFASAQGKHEQAWKLIFKAYYSDRAPIWTIDDLLAFAASLDLDPDAARAALETRRYHDAVKADHADAIALGARGVPFIVIDRRVEISGRSSRHILAAIEAYAEKLDRPGLRAQHASA